MKFNLYKSSHYAGRRTVETDLTAAGSRNRKNGELGGRLCPRTFFNNLQKIKHFLSGFQ